MESSLKKEQQSSDDDISQGCVFVDATQFQIEDNKVRKDMSKASKHDMNQSNMDFLK